jgi:dienelactone hydrolase
MQLLLTTILVLLMAAPSVALGDIVEREVEYSHGKDKLIGFLAYDETRSGPLPGVIVVHEWRGLNKHAKTSARRLARLGYTAFAVDMYGNGETASTAEEAMKLSEPFLKDRPLMRARAEAGLKAFRETGMVDPGRIAAIGYCFGGTTVLEMARGGLMVSGAVSFHGGLSSPRAADSLPCPVLILHGAADPHVGPEEAEDFREEMRNADADWRMIYFGGAVHGFTNPAAGSDPSKGVAYDVDAARRSRQYMEMFLKEVLNPD